MSGNDLRNRGDTYVTVEYEEIDKKPQVKLIAKRKIENNSTLLALYCVNFARFEDIWFSYNDENPLLQTLTAGFVHPHKGFEMFMNFNVLSPKFERIREKINEKMQKLYKITPNKESGSSSCLEDLYDFVHNKKKLDTKTKFEKIDDADLDQFNELVRYTCLEFVEWAKIINRHRTDFDRGKSLYRRYQTAGYTPYSLKFLQLTLADENEHKHYEALYPAWRALDKETCLNQNYQGYRNVTAMFSNEPRKHQTPNARCQWYTDENFLNDEPNDENKRAWKWFNNEAIEPKMQLVSVNKNGVIEAGEEITWCYGKSKQSEYEVSDACNGVQEEIDQSFSSSSGDIEDDAMMTALKEKHNVFLSDSDTEDHTDYDEELEAINNPEPEIEKEDDPRPSGQAYLDEVLFFFMQISDVLDLNSNFSGEYDSLRVYSNHNIDYIGEIQWQYLIHDKKNKREKELEDEDVQDLLEAKLRRYYFDRMDHTFFDEQIADALQNRMEREARRRQETNFVGVEINSSGYSFLL